MAEEKKSVLLYCDIIHTVEGLEDEEAGRLFKHYLRYINDMEPVAPDRITQIAFEPIKQTLKRDLKKWEMIKVKRSDAGKKSAETKKALTSVETASTQSTHVEFVEQDLTQSTVSVNVNDSVNVIVKEINNKPLGFLMQTEFLNANKFYPPAPSKDIPAIMEIAMFLHNQNGGIKKEMFELDIGEQDSILNEWGEWCKWYQQKGNNKSLEYLVKFKLQDIYLEIKSKARKALPVNPEDIASITSQIKMVY